MQSVTKNQNNLIASLKNANAQLKAEIMERQRAEKALQELVEKYQKTSLQLRTLINAMPDIVCFKDGTGKWLEANQSMQELFEIEKVDYRGKSDIELGEISSFYREAFLSCHHSDREAWKKKSLSRGEEIIPKRDGSIKIYDVIKVPLFYEDGKRNGIVVLGRDITEQKQTEKVMIRLASIVESSNDAVIGNTLEGIIYSWNSGAEAIYGYSISEVKGCSISILAVPERPNEISQILANITAGASINNYETVHIRKDGKHIDVALTISPIKDTEGNIIGVSTIARDISDRKQIEKSFEQLRYQHQLILNSAGEGICGIDIWGKISFANPAAARMTGYTIKELVNSDWSLIISGVGEGRRKKEEGRSKKEEGRSKKEEERREKLMGTQTPTNSKHCVDSGVLNHKEKDKVNNKEEGRSKKEEERREKLMGTQTPTNSKHCVDSGVLNHKEKDKVNNKEEGRSKKEEERREKLMGTQTPTNSKHCVDSGVLNHKEKDKVNDKSSKSSAQKNYSDSQVTTTLKKGIVCQVTDEFFERRDGSHFPVEYVSTPILEQGKIIGAVVTFKDITERQAVEQMKDEFISVVSHELRTPLASIQGALTLLKSGLLNQAPERGNRMLNIAVTNTDRLVRLINDILDLERLHSQQVTMLKQTCNIAELMLQTASEMQPIAEKAGVNLSVKPVNTKLWGCPDKLIQTLTNLLSNAIKYSPKGTTVWLTASKQVINRNHTISSDNFTSTVKTKCTEAPAFNINHSYQVLIAVKDQGRGIPADQIESIFGRFQQVDASDSRQKGGTGLGLAICRNIVQQHQGKIWAESTLGEGSTFFVALPILDEE
ncbi:MAG: PAS domain S-box protein [Okeania sp. SIO2C9]|uniref:PAS domain S-box protein n=1 Tax=Okeania sp. SIO2C9 TaxID=2607791 RepID=UPI0013C2677F|nr:PAS domain S-box protein [Okeania sp. SIO2C9]NEQ77757.1 PAS domain S-box protein [Okeania sp. SIO2C9]